MDKAEAMKKASEFSKLAGNYLKFTNAVLFGSYVNGIPREDSDIDIAFFVDQLNEDQDYFLLLVQLNKLAREIDSRIEPHIFGQNSRSGFGHVIKTNGQRIN